MVTTGGCVLLVDLKLWLHHLKGLNFARPELQEQNTVELSWW